MRFCGNCEAMRSGIVSGTVAKRKKTKNKKTKEKTENLLHNCAEKARSVEDHRRFNGEFSSSGATSYGKIAHIKLSEQSTFLVFFNPLESL